MLFTTGGSCLWAGSQEAEAGAGNCWVTGYASSQFPGLTADGTPTLGNEWSLVAVDPRVIPLGSYVTIDGLGTFRAADTGGGVRGCHVDVLVRWPSEAYALTGTYWVSW